LMMHKMLLACALLEVSGRRVKKESESSQSEQEGKDLGPPAYKALVPLLMAFSPNPSDALGFAPGVFRKGGSRSLASAGLSPAFEKTRARRPETWPETPLVPAFEKNWYQTPLASTQLSPEFEKTRARRPEHWPEKQVNWYHTPLASAELSPASEKTRARWPEHWPEQESNWYQKPWARKQEQWSRAHSAVSSELLHASDKMRARWPETWPETGKESNWYQKKVPAARAGLQPTMMAPGEADPVGTSHNSNE